MKISCSLFPDWKKRQIILTNPAIWPRYTNGQKDLGPVFLELEAVLRSWNVEVEVLQQGDTPLDIWIRDWGFVEGAFFLYSPDYARGLYSTKDIATARRALVQRLGLRCRSLPIVLDGGNLIHKGKVALLTEKVCAENKHLTCLEIERSVLSLGFERVVFLPVEPGDEIGHADGMCRFLSEDILLVNNYDMAPMRSFARRLRRVLKAAKLDAEIVELPWFYQDEATDGVPSAVGCYMNFIYLAQGIILPTFENRKDDQALDILRSLTQTPVAPVFATPLARLGGVFNCASLSF